MREFGVKHCWGYVIAANRPALDFNLSLGFLPKPDQDECLEKPIGPEQVYLVLTWDNLVRAAPPAVIRDFLPREG
jgi:hypothetical protein